MITKTKKVLGSFGFVIPLFTILGCASNIEHIPTTTQLAPQAMTFDAPLERVWSAAMTSLSTDSTFKILDKSSGIVVTEFKTIDSKELSLVGTYFLGKTYKSSYTLNFRPLSATKTEVRVNVALQAQQMVLLNREEDQPQVTSHMRQRLYEQITVNLKR